MDPLAILAMLKDISAHWFALLAVGTAQSAQPGSHCSPSILNLPFVVPFFCRAIKCSLSWWERAPDLDAQQSGTALGGLAPNEWRRGRIHC